VTKAGRRRLAGALAAVLLSVALTASSPALEPETGAVDIVVASRPIPRFDPNASSGSRFGAFDYVGGFAYSSRNPWLEGVSAIRMLPADRFLAVTDTGYWFAGTIRRDATGAPVGIGDARLAPLLDEAGRPPLRKGEADAEGLAVDAGGDALVSFERIPRIAVYADAASPFASRARLVKPLPIKRRELRGNAGMEAIAAAPPGSPLGGRIVVVTEKSLDANGNLFAAILGPGGGVFAVRREDPWTVTDAAFLPGGDLLVLERRYQGFVRVGMRIRRIDGRSVRPGALVDGEVLMEADLAQEIDNMEGLDVYRASDGSTRIVLVSDDNGSFFQRNLFLEFRLAEGDAAAASD
jgi:hypothetical protein